jgi:hypothetical protein
MEGCYEFRGMIWVNEPYYVRPPELVLQYTNVKPYINIHYSMIFGAKDHQIRDGVRETSYHLGIT